MLTTPDIAETSLNLIVARDDGEEHVVVFTPRRHGRLSISCSCQAFSHEAWCRHVVDLLCMRLRDLGLTDLEVEERLVALVADTEVERQAHDVDRAVIAFEQAMADFASSGRVTATVRIEAVTVAAERARDVADTGLHAAEVINRFRRTLRRLDGAQ